MINRYYKTGEKLDVSGLNELIVLIDRSETELTEVALNTWKPNLLGPPHKHTEKDQIFYVTTGVGYVMLGDKKFDVKPGCLAYVPAGTVHQTVSSTDEPLEYMLFNIFNDPSKEGHASFADHIEKVKAIRKQQAESGNAGVDNVTVDFDLKPFKFFTDIRNGKVYEFGSNSTVLLLDRAETNRAELTLVSWPAGNKGALVAHKEKEQTFFVIEGKGWVTIGDETQEVVPGNVIFVPRNTPHTTEAADVTLSYLCMNSLPGEVADGNFDEMFNRVAAERIKRWKAGSTEVGE